MATSFDCRKDIRETIGTLKAINNDDWEEQYVISVTADGMDYDIPIYLAEESASLEEPPFPFIDLNIMNVTYDPHVRSVKLRRDGSGKQAIYHYVIEIYAIYYDL